jgi:hypothetical protein
MVIFKTSRRLRLVSAKLNKNLHRRHYDWRRLRFFHESFRHAKGPAVAEKLNPLCSGADPKLRTGQSAGAAVPGFAVSPSISWRLVVYFLVMADSRSGHPQRARNYTAWGPYYKPFSGLFLPDCGLVTMSIKSTAY